MLKRIVSTFAVTACLAGMVFAQEDLLRPAQGARYIGGGANWTTVSGNNTYHILVNFGYFFTSQVVGEGEFGYQGTDSDWSYTLSAKVKYLFTKDSAAVPYLDAGILYAKDNFIGADDTVLMLGGGIDYFVKPTQSFFIDVSAYKPKWEDDWIFSTTFGFRMYFK